MGTKDVKLNGNQLPIREFKLDWMVEDPSICMVAKRGSGKSYVCRALLKHFKENLPGGIIIAPTDKMSSFYGDFFPELYIHYEYSSEIIENVLYRQSKIIEKADEKKKLGKRVNPHAFILMDDCLSSKGTWMNDKPILDIFFNGRHYKLMFILTMQFPLGIRPELRANFDYIFLLAEDFYSNQKRIYDHYAGMFPNFEAFRQVFLQLTDSFGSMVIVNRGQRKTLLDKVFWYKAGDDKIDVMGNKQFNDFHKRNYDKNWKFKNKQFDFNKFAENKKKGRIVVEKVESNNGNGNNNNNNN